MIGFKIVCASKCNNLLFESHFAKKTGVFQIFTYTFSLYLFSLKNFFIKPAHSSFIIPEVVVVFG